MNKKLKRIIATMTAGATMAAVASFFAACGENTAEDKYLNLPDEPVILWEYYYNCYSEYTTKFRVGEAANGRIYSKTPIDVSGAEIKLDGSYFYYVAGLEKVYDYQTDCTDVAGLELFMEYNGADWDELLTLYSDNRNDYSEEINDWQTRYDGVKENICLDVYEIVIKSISEEEYNDPTQLSEYYKNLYDSGALKLYAPETDEVTTLTTATLTLGDKTITHEFGKSSDIVEGLNIGPFDSGEYYAGTCFSVYKEDESVALFKESDCAVGEAIIPIIPTEGVAETREWFDVTIKDVRLLYNDFLTIEPIEVKYINTFGVAASVEWDGGEFTLSARNTTAEDSGSYAFAIYFNIKSSRAIPSYSTVNIYLDVEISLRGADGNLFMQSDFPVLNAIGAEYYAYMIDGVDITAREEVWGYYTKRLNDAASNWENHMWMETESIGTLWDTYVSTGSLI